MRPSAALFGGVLIVTAALAACGGDERELVGLTRDPAPQVDAVALPDVSRDGEPFEFRADDGGLLVVYFGYTNCPDVCPTTMADLRTALKDIGDDAERVDVAMVTIDPARDTPVLADYVQSFVPDAHAVATDDQAALQSVAAPFGVSYEVHTDATGEIEVGHTSALFAVDDTGHLVITWTFPTPADDLAGDLRQLLAATDDT
ncbi:MAG: SCO family protein [Ilumatobacteraceae bacterium]